MAADHRPRVEIRMPDGAGTLAVPLVKLVQRSSGKWAAVVGLPKYVDLGRIGATDADNELAAWEELMTVPPGEYRDIPGQDYSRIKRESYRDTGTGARPARQDEPDRPGLGERVDRMRRGVES